jgi:hypothetical protein
VLVPRILAEGRFQGAALGDLGYRGAFRNRAGRRPGSFQP